MWRRKLVGEDVKNCVSCYRELVCLRPSEYARLARQESVNLNGYNLLENESGKKQNLQVILIVNKNIVKTRL